MDKQMRVTGIESAGIGELAIGNEMVGVGVIEGVTFEI